MITLKQLRYLDALARTAISAGPRTPARSRQPALSMQIRDLEKELGAELVERGRAT